MGDLTAVIADRPAKINRWPLTSCAASRYAVCTSEKNDVGFGNLFFRGGRPPAKRFFYVRDMAVSMSVPCGRPSGLPVPLIRFANLHGIARPVWQRESDEKAHIRGVSYD